MSTRESRPRSPRPKAPERRSYQQYCGLARGLDLVGERWTLLIVRNLLLGPRRYSDLLAELPGITTNLLAKRLQDMEATGLIVREDRPPPVPATVYALSELGAALEPVLSELGRWGGRFLDGPKPGDIFNLGWGLLSLKRRYRGGLAQVIALETDEQRFELAFAADHMTVTERAAVRPALTVRGKLPALKSWLFGGASPEALRKAGKLSVEGPEAIWRGLLAAFAPMPSLPSAPPRL